MQNHQNTSIPRNRDELEDLAIGLTAQWLYKLQLLNRSGKYQSKTLERSALELLQVVLPSERLVDANDLVKNHAVIDILSGDKKFGIQVKLTLNPAIVRQVREDWDKAREPGGLLAGATRLWILGADLSAKNPDPTTGPWKQVEDQEWALLIDKLALTDRSHSELEAICSVLEKHLHRVETQVSNDDQIEDTYKLVKGVLDSLKEISSGTGIYYLPKVREAVEPRIGRAISNKDVLESSLPVIRQVIGVRAFAQELERTFKTIDDFAASYQRVADYWEKEFKPVLRRRDHLPDEADWPRTQYENLRIAMEKRYRDAVAQADELTRWLETHYEDICKPKLPWPSVPTGDRDGSATSQ